MSTEKFTKPVLAIFIMLIASIVLNPRVADAQESCAQEIASIRADTKRIDRLIKQRQNPPTRRSFARLGDDVREPVSEWIVLEDNRPIPVAFADAASVWFIDGKLVAVELTTQSPAQNWVHRIMYYYREDHTLARIDSNLNYSAGARIVVSEHFYDRKGVALSKSTQHYTVKRAARRQPGLASLEEPIPLYLRITELPFYDQIDRSPGPLAR
jgi:hypothetical protein